MVFAQRGSDGNHSNRLNMIKIYSNILKLIKQVFGCFLQTEFVGQVVWQTPRKFNISRLGVSAIPEFDRICPVTTSAPGSIGTKL